MVRGCQALWQKAHRVTPSLGILESPESRSTRSNDRASELSPDVGFRKKRIELTMSVYNFDPGPLLFKSRAGHATLKELCDVLFVVS